MEMLTETELAKRIKDEREKQHISLQKVGEWIGKSRQHVHRLEDPKVKGAKANETRMEILSMLLGLKVVGPLFRIEDQFEITARPPNP